MRQALILSLLATAAPFTLQARAAEQTRSVAPFTAVSNTGPISVHIGRSRSSPAATTISSPTCRPRSSATS